MLACLISSIKQHDSVIELPQKEQHKKKRFKKMAKRLRSTRQKLKFDDVNSSSSSESSRASSDDEEDSDSRDRMVVTMQSN